MGVYYFPSLALCTLPRLGTRYRRAQVPTACEQGVCVIEAAERRALSLSASCPRAMWVRIVGAAAALGCARIPQSSLPCIVAVGLRVGVFSLLQHSEVWGVRSGNWRVDGCDRRRADMMGNADATRTAPSSAPRTVGGVTSVNRQGWGQEGGERDAAVEGGEDAHGMHGPIGERGGGGVAVLPGAYYRACCRAPLGASILFIHFWVHARGAHVGAVTLWGGLSLNLRQAPIHIRNR
ncbi:hypothetical protein DFH07DRAFT_966529 [Mycena maculata]|uniref:Uncharacterized protein n=1 Tax=Mycena maculata TaxID=230809 RepID=A0AAD7I9U8_9AGAR|nr:hypothetical protein DFH07DRAFT_966529 [Mycena maculata]